MFQWLGLGAFTAVAPSSVPGWGTKILQAQKKKKVLFILPIEFFISFCSSWLQSCIMFLQLEELPLTFYFIVNNFCWWILSAVVYLKITLFTFVLGKIFSMDMEITNWYRILGLRFSKRKWSCLNMLMTLFSVLHCFWRKVSGFSEHCFLYEIFLSLPPGWFWCFFFYYCTLRCFYSILTIRRWR